MLNVLIVEDNLDIAELEARALADYADAVQLVTGDFGRLLQPDLWLGVTCAVVDLMLPHLDGEEVCRYLRDEQPEVRRVICTAKPTSQIAGLSGLAHVVLQKPFLVEDLIAAVIDDA